MKGKSILCRFHERIPASFEIGIYVVMKHLLENTFAVEQNGPKILQKLNRKFSPFVILMPSSGSNQIKVELMTVTLSRMEV